MESGGGELVREGGRECERERGGGRKGCLGYMRNMHAFASYMHVREAFFSPVFVPKVLLFRRGRGRLGTYGSEDKVAKKGERGVHRIEVLLEDVRE